VAGHVMLRLADGDLMPFQARDFAAAIGSYVDEIEQHAARMRERALENHRLLDAKVYELAASATDPVAPPAREEDVPYLNFAPIRNASEALNRAAADFDGAYQRALADPARLTAERAATVNGLLRGAEQSLLGTDGLPGRPWYRHLIYAPGLHTGYGAKTMPGVREAVEEGRWAEAADYVGRTAFALDAYRGALEAATAALH
jgi:N-acetylated-alpha-linked acidic dipeptidase